MTNREDIKSQFRDNYLRYASYVILDRAIPELTDGLKPVQRRILWTLFTMDDGKLHKVANVAGQTMALHPHGDSPIVDALVTLANKGFLLDRQGNFGNPHTGDPAAAARYIETRLSPLAKETLFQPALTQFTASYDGRNQEPITLPAKIPLLLLLGTEGIAVGMATRIFPHNFNEVLQAQIAILQGKPFQLFPDFASGGIMDPSDYEDGKGKIRLRAQIDVVDEKTLVIRHICPGTTTESVIRSIDEAAKKGLIKIDTIQDYTAEHIEIEIKLPRGQYAATILDALYAFTDCAVTLHGQPLAIRERLPWEGSISEILRYQTDQLVSYLKQELELEAALLQERIFRKTLEQLFIEHRLYRNIEPLTTSKAIHETLSHSLTPFHSQLSRVPTDEDRDHLLTIPIRRISLFDLRKHQEQLEADGARIQEIQKELQQLKQVAIRYLKHLLQQYGTAFPRKTIVGTIETLDKRALSKQEIRVGYDSKTGFLGTKVTGPDVQVVTTVDKLLLFSQQGTYRVIPIPEKSYYPDLVWWGVADRTLSFYAVFHDEKRIPWAKHFHIKQWILSKEYGYLDPTHTLLSLSITPPTLNLRIEKKGKAEAIHPAWDDMPSQNAKAKGKRLSTHPLARGSQKKRN